jgi:hypothetical protein
VKSYIPKPDETLASWPTSSFDACLPCAAGNNSKARYHLPVFDLEKNQKMILTVGEAGRKVLREMIRRLDQAKADELMMKRQRAKARGFRLNRMKLR